MKFLTRLKHKLSSLGRTIDTYQEKITFSQANAYDASGGQPEVMTCRETEKRNLVVACNNSIFPDEMIEYAIDMATRMDYGIIAVNAANLTHDVTEFFSSSHETLFTDFKQSAQKNITAFRTLAETKGLSFAHAIKFSDIDRAVEEITKECGEIEFIISENRDRLQQENSMKNENRIAQRLFVYSVN